jgi:hypothetical protein
MTDNRLALTLNQEFLCSLDYGEAAGALSASLPTIGFEPANVIELG